MTLWRRLEMGYHPAEAALPTGSRGSGKETEAEAGEVFEVLVEGDEGDAVTTGEGGEVGIHPDFG